MDNYRVYKELSSDDQGFDVICSSILPGSPFESMFIQRTLGL